MSMSPIERAARALHRSRMERQYPKPDDHPWESLSPRDQKLRMLDVKVILNALRDPSEAMVSAGGEKTFAGSYSAAQAGAVNAWRAMIDTILADEPTA